MFLSSAAASLSHCMFYRVGCIQTTGCGCEKYPIKKHNFSEMREFFGAKSSWLASGLLSDFNARQQKACRLKYWITANMVGMVSAHCGKCS